MYLETFETDRLLLKKLTPEILADLFVQKTEEEISELMGLTSHEAFLKEKEKVTGGYRTYDRSMVAFLMIEKATGKTIGRGGFHNWYAAHRRAELGYLIYDEKHRGKGYMREAIKVIINYGFNAMNLNRIEAFIGPGNMASLQTIRPYGFQQEGHMKQHFVRDGIAEDSLVFALLREAFERNGQSR